MQKCIRPTFSGVEVCSRQGESESGKPNASKRPTSPKPLFCVTYADFGCFCARLSASVMRRWTKGRRGEGGIKVGHILLSADNSREPILLSVTVGLNKRECLWSFSYLAPSPVPVFILSACWWCLMLLPIELASFGTIYAHTSATKQCWCQSDLAFLYQMEQLGAEMSFFWHSQLTIQKFGSLLISEHVKPSRQKWLGGLGTTLWLSIFGITVCISFTVEKVFTIRPHLAWFLATGTSALKMPSCQQL